MTTGVALAVTLAVMACVNVWVYAGPRSAHMVTGPVGAIVLLLVARSSGLSWTELGLGRDALTTGIWYGAGAAALVAVGVATAVAIPATRGAFRDTRYQLSPRPAVRTALVTVPLATVVFEEVAFRGVLWGLLAHDHGAVWATWLSSVLFGLWHILPAVDLLRTNTALGQGPKRQGRALVTVLGTVAFTTVAGLLFAELRRRSGSLAAPAGLHWSANGLGVLAAAWVWAISRS